MTDLDMDSSRPPIREEDDAKTPLDHESNALTVAYGHVTSHITEFAKLQYQLVGIAYALAGAILTFIGSGTAKPQLLLYFPAIFCGIVLVQFYLHSSIKMYGRYLNFKLRPRMEVIINTGTSLFQRRTIWDWEAYYDSLLATPSSKQRNVVKLIRDLFTPQTAVRVLGVIIVILPIIPAGIIYVLYQSYVPSSSSACITIPIINLSFLAATSDECTLLRIDTATIVFTLILFVLVYWANVQWSSKEEARVANEDAASIVALIENWQRSGKFAEAEKGVEFLVKTYPDDKVHIDFAKGLTRIDAPPQPSGPAEAQPNR